MALQPAERFTEFNVAMWSLSFFKISFNGVTLTDLKKQIMSYYAQATLIANTKIRRVKKTQYLLKSPFT